MPRRIHLVLLALALLIVVALIGGCSAPVQWLGVRLFYQEAELGSGRVLRDIPYKDGSSDEKHLLDLFVPEGAGWPTLVFVHGGGWTSGAKDLVVGGADVYGNIGRFLASRGIGAAIINYRLQPAVTWREQVDDVARAVAWVHRHAADHGGDPRRLFLSGHSAGAQLSTFVALAPGPLAALGLSPDILCGVVPVSGAGYDIADEKTYELGAKRSYYEQRFRAGPRQAGDPGDGWKREASAIAYLSPGAPPFLLIHGSREWQSLHHQNRLLDRALRAAGAASRVVVVEGQSHSRIVLALSRRDTVPGAEIVDFVLGTDCAGRGNVAAPLP